MMQYHDIIFCIFVWSLGLSVTQAKPLLNTYIVQLANSSIVNSFPPSTFAQNYSIRHRFNSEELFTGVSLTLTDTNDASDIVLSARLRQLSGVVSVFPVPAVTPPKVASVVAARDVSTSPYEEYPSPQPMTPIVGTKNSKLASPLEMTGIDKLHSLGIKGRGMKIAFLDTGVDYRHPALGGGFGRGHKIAGGYSFMDDSGALVNSTDPFADCLSDVGGHGTHVTGIATMQRCANCAFDIEGVAPEASVYMYRVFGCDGGEAGLDTHFAAMLMAANEGVDVISMSIGDGDVNIADPTNPFSTTAAAIKQKGIAIFAAAANDATGGVSATNLRTVEFPGADSNIIAVGSVVNAQWPTMYSATDSNGNSFSYASIFPFNTTKMDVYVVSSPCDSDQWATILPGVNLNTTVFVFEGTIGCNLADATSSWRELVEPQDVYAISYQGNWTTDPYLQSVGADTPGFLPDRNLAEFFQADGLSLMEQYTKAGGYPNYKLSFADKHTFSVPLETGGMMDYYSSFGPVGVEPLKLKPQLSAPGGNILSTYPLGPGSGYAISSGTSMSTPFAAASYMLIKSQLPHATVDQILERMQTTSTPLKWIYDTSILSATAQQGSGLINCYNAIFGTTLVSPGELNIGDATPSSPAKATITIKNDALISKAYRLSQQGAAYMDQILNSTGQNQFETGQLPNYGSAKFSSSVILLRPGQETSVTMSISPPPGVDEEQLPIFGGFITITDITDRTAAILSVPYIARPYSLYNATYIPQIIAGQITVPGILCYNENTGEANYPVNGTLACDFTDGSQVNILSNLAQYTMLYRIDVVPVNTTLIPTHWAPGSPSTPPGYTYTPPASPPSSSVLGGVPSYGNIYNLNPTANIEYAANPQSTIVTNLPWSGSVTADSSSTVQLGNGDYRLLISVLRWGGNDSVTADYETWLGPIMTLS